MKQAALDYYFQGMDCTRSILMAVKRCHGDKITEEVIAASGALSNGFGIGGFCGALIAGIMVLSALLGEDEAKSKRILFVSDFHCNFRGTNCHTISRGRNDCREVIAFVCDWLESAGI